jgi:serine/threonine protein kinase
MTSNRIGREIIGPASESFRIETMLGNGSFGEVYRCVGTKSGTVAAVKMVPQHKLTDPSTLSIKTVLNEARVAMLQVNHPNVVRVLHVDTGSDSGVGPYVMMEYVEGGNLQDLITRTQTDGRQLTLDEAISLMRGIALGAQAINEHLVHRDMKPDNILLDGPSACPIPRIADFGIAKIAAEPTRPETFKSTQPIWYMAPEAWREEKNTYKMDVYSIGLVFYEILTLNHPLVSFVGDPTDWVRWRAVHLSQACPDVRNARPDTPLTLAKLVMRMTDKSPGNRPSWDEVLSALNIPTVTPPGTQPIDLQLMAAMKGLADQRFRQEQKKTEAELARDREAERDQGRSQEFDQSSRRLLAQFDEVIQALNEQEPAYPIKIDGDGVRFRNYTLPNGRKLTCQLFGLTKKLEKPAIGAGYLGVNGGLSANLMLSGQEDDIASGHWSAVEVNVMALIYGQTELKLLREAGLPDETIRFVLHMDGNEPWRRDSPTFFGFQDANLFYEHYAVGHRAMHVYSFQIRPDVVSMFTDILKLGLRMP